MVAQLIERFTGPRTKVPVREYGTLLLKYLRQQKGIVALASALILTNIGLQLVNPQIMRYFIDEAVAGSPLGTLVTAAVLFIAVALVQQVIGVARDVHERQGRVERHKLPALRPRAPRSVARYALPQQSTRRER